MQAYGGGTQLGSATPVGLVLPFALTLLDKAVSLSLQFSSQSRCKLFSCPDFWLHPRSLTQSLLLTVAAKQRAVLLVILSWQR